MDWDSLGPLGVFLGVLGGGIAWIVNLWLGRADRREDRMIKYLEAEKAEAEAEAAAERAARIKWEKRAIAWYKQLVDAGLDPVPPWGED